MNKERRSASVRLKRLRWEWNVGVGAFTLGPNPKNENKVSKHIGGSGRFWLLASKFTDYPPCRGLRVSESSGAAEGEGMTNLTGIDAE
jgi:hypothetical protein